MSCDHMSITCQIVKTRSSYRHNDSKSRRELQHGDTEQIRYRQTFPCMNLACRNSGMEIVESGEKCGDPRCVPAARTKNKAQSNPAACELPVLDASIRYCASLYGPSHRKFDGNYNISTRDIRSVRVKSAFGGHSRNISDLKLTLQPRRPTERQWFLVSPDGISSSSAYLYLGGTNN